MDMEEFRRLYADVLEDHPVVSQDTPPWEDEPAPAIQPEPVSQEPKIEIPRIAIIGTAGRDKSIFMTQAMWEWMVLDASKRLPEQCHLVSGGAAWADHIAVALYLADRVQGLTLHLPAPLGDEPGIFVGPANSSASAANYYHEKFSRVIKESSLRHIKKAIEKGATWTCQPSQSGYGGMFTRNNIIANDCVGMLAYTFSQSDVPGSTGTLDTWTKCQGTKLHVTIPR
jgi:hypothetical protein